MTRPGKGTSCVRLTVTGIVQGVGFRPFLHRLAVQNGICGWVRNTSSGRAAGGVDALFGHTLVPAAAHGGRTVGRGAGVRAAA